MAISKKKYKHHILEDLVILALGIIIAVILARLGIIENLAKTFSIHLVIISFVSGLFFTSVFTVIPATALIIYLSEFISPISLIFFGGLGAAIADTVIFLFVRDRLMRDAEENASKFKKFRKLVSKSFLSYFAPLIGALIIASPLPDEIGLALMGFTKTNARVVFVTAFFCNMLGIAVICGLSFLIL